MSTDSIKNIETAVFDLDILYNKYECTLWGDYFYFEALIRLYQAWYSYW